MPRPGRHVLAIKIGVDANMQQDHMWTPYYQELAEIYKEVMLARLALRNRHFSAYAEHISNVRRLSKTAEMHAAYSGHMQHGT